MNIFAEIIHNISAENFEQLKITEPNLQSALICAITSDNYTLVSDIVTKSKLDLNFGNDSPSNETVRSASPLDHDGKIPNPLLSAIVYSRTAIVMLLLENGADKNILTPRKTNAVHYALENNRMALAVYLVRNGLPLDTEEAKASDYMNDMITDKTNFLAFLEEEASEEASACNDSLSSAQGRKNKFMNVPVSASFKNIKAVEASLLLKQVGASGTGTITYHYYL